MLKIKISLFVILSWQLDFMVEEYTLTSIFSVKNFKVYQMTNQNTHKIKFSQRNLWWTEMWIAKSPEHLIDFIL